MPNLHQPAISKIVVPHFLFLEPRRRIRRIGDRDETIVIRTLHVIDPGIGRRDLMEGEIGAGRKLRVVGVNLADLKTPAGARPSRSAFRKPLSLCPAMPLPHASPCLPKSTGHAGPVASHFPLYARSNNCICPRIEFQSGAVPTINCVQSSGTPAAYALLTSSSISNFRRDVLSISQT